MNDTDIRLVYVTTANQQEAERLGQELVAKRLAACVNIIEGMTSIYWWQGQIQHDQETVLIAKTTRQRIDELIRDIKKQHSYQVPCVVALPILEGNPDYLKWIETETKAEVTQG